MNVLKLLQSFTANGYRLDIPATFVERFFQQRRLIAATTRDYLAKNERLLKGVEHAVRMGGTELWGQSTIEENFALDSLIQEMKPARVVEIGLFRGQTALTINHSLTQCGAGSYLGIDISADTIAIVNEVLTKASLMARAELKLADSSTAGAAVDRVDFAFVDGDHNWNGVVADVVGLYNRMAAGGVIAMHDVGSPAWGWTCQDPGRLLHEVLPKHLAGHAEIHWLDSVCRELTMKLLSPNSSGPDRYFETMEKSLAVAEITMKDTVRGWGGLGFIYKRDANHRLDLNELLACRPPTLLPAVGQPAGSRIKRKLMRLIDRLP